MKIYAVTDARGRLIGTVRPSPEESAEDSPRVGVAPYRGQRIYELELPKELQHELREGDDIGAFHLAIEKLVQQSRKAEKGRGVRKTAPVKIPR
jgi:hypothetical protein